MKAPQPITLKTLIRYATLGLAVLALPAFAQQPNAAERVAALKATMAASQVVLIVT